MQFAIGSNLRHMSDKVSIFNAAHPCFLKCILLDLFYYLLFNFFSLNRWNPYRSKFYAVMSRFAHSCKIAIFVRLQKIARIARFAVFLTHVIFATFCKVDEVQSANLLLL